jgi:hypothetical protein
MIAPLAGESGKRRALFPTQVVFGDGVDGAEEVFHANFLAFGVAAAGIRDGDLEDAQMPLGHLGGDLGLEAEAVLLDGDLFQGIGAKNLVAGLSGRDR